jgi:uncharacterized protein YuzE
MNRHDFIASIPSPPGLCITHDPAANVAYVYLADRRESGGSHRCEYALGNRVVFDLDAQDRILGLELLDARMLRPETLEQAGKPPRSAQDHLEPLDRSVLAACGGDRSAIELLCRKLQGILLLEAADALGFRRRQEAQDVVQNLWLGLAEGSYRFPIIRGAGLAWLKRAVRSLAAEHLRTPGAR